MPLWQLLLLSVHIRVTVKRVMCVWGIYPVCCATCELDWSIMIQVLVTLVLGGRGGVGRGKRTRNSRPALAKQSVLGQPWLHEGSVSQNNTQINLLTYFQL